MSKFSSNDGVRLKEALRAADASSGPLPLLTASRLLDAAAGRRRRVQGTRLVSGVGVAVVGFAMLAQDQTSHQVVGPPRVSPAASVASFEQTKAELDALRREAVLQERVIRGVQRAAALQKWRADYERGGLEGNQELFGEEAARSAAISWRYATMVEHGLGNREEAIREYRRVAERFSGTEWAELAANSVARLTVVDESSPSS